MKCYIKWISKFLGHKQEEGHSHHEHSHHDHSHCNHAEAKQDHTQHTHHDHDCGHSHADMKQALIMYAVAVVCYLMATFIPLAEFIRIILYLATVALSGQHLFAVGLGKTIKETCRTGHFIPDTHLMMTLAIVGAIVIGQFSEAAILILIFSGSHFLEDYAENKSKKEMTALYQMQPTQARRFKADGGVEIVDVSELMIGDRLQVLNGDKIAIDGEIIEGYATLNEASINGESVPKEKTVGDEVFASTINGNTTFTMIVTKAFQDTVFSKIVELVKQAQASETATATRIKKIEPFYVTSAIVFSLLFFIFSPLIFNWSYQVSLYKMCVMFIAVSPCALVASAVPATLSALSNLSKQGILVKGGAYLSRLVELKAISFDKTGTLTQGKPIVTDFVFEQEKLLIPIVVGMEKQANHPLAQAIVEHFGLDQSIDCQIVNHIGKGIETTYQNDCYQIFKPSAFKSITNQLNVKRQELEESGKTVVFIAKNGRVVGFIALMDVANLQAYPVMSYFNQQAVNTIMITGDAKSTAQTVAKKLGIQYVFANQLPEEKAKLVKKIRQKFGVTAMVGDGVNDAPALVNADIAVAMGEGTDVAMESSDVILLKNKLTNLTYLHRMAKKLDHIVWQNIIFSMIVVLTMVVMNIFDLSNIALSVVGHEGSTILVILNGLRLLVPLKEFKGGKNEL